MGISRSQAQLVAEGFLDNQASTLEGRQSLVPRETFTEVILIAGEMAEEMQENLTKSNASGSLSKSIVIGTPSEHGKVFKVDILMNDYGQYINKGVKGTKSGAGAFRFKNENPSPKMLIALQKGMIRAKRKTTNVNRAKSTSKNEIKNSNNAKARAWGAAVNIKRYGIKATGFLDKAIVTTEQKFEDRLGDAIALDITTTLLGK